MGDYARAAATALMGATAAKGYMGDYPPPINPPKALGSIDCTRSLIDELIAQAGRVEATLDREFTRLFGAESETAGTLSGGDLDRREPGTLEALSIRVKTLSNKLTAIQAQVERLSAI